MQQEDVSICTDLNMATEAWKEEANTIVSDDLVCPNYVLDDGDSTVIDCAQQVVPEEELHVLDF